MDAIDKLLVAHREQIDARDREIASLQLQLKEAQAKAAAIYPYICHMDLCPVLDDLVNGKCNCGLDALTPAPECETTDELVGDFCGVMADVRASGEDL